MSKGTGSDDDLDHFHSFVKPACRHLGLDPARTEADLLEISERYSRLRMEEVNVARVSTVVQQLGDIHDAPMDKRWPRRFDGLDPWTVLALVGGFPVASTTLSEACFDHERPGALETAGRRRYVPAANDDIERQEMKRAVDESASGFVVRRRLPGFFEFLCIHATAANLSAMMAGMGHAIRCSDISEDEKHDLAQRLASRVLAVSRMVDGQSVIAYERAWQSASDRTALVLEFMEGQVGKMVDEVRPVAGERTDAARFFAELLEGFFKEIDQGLQKAGLLALARANDAGFRVALGEIKLRLERQYDKETNPTGLGRRMTRDYSAHAGWRLITEVLDVAWPSNNGPLGAVAREPVSNLVEVTFNRGEALFETSSRGTLRQDVAANIQASGIGNGGGNEERAFNADHLKEIANLRNATWQLDRVLAELNRRLFATREAREACGQPLDVDIDRLESTILALRAWRRGLNIRLHRGSYDRKRRDDAISFPVFPQMKADVADDVREEKIVAKARPLIDEIQARHAQSPRRVEGAMAAKTDQPTAT